MEEQNTNGNGYFKGNIDARVRNLEENVEKIMENHLPHIQDRLDKLDAKLGWILTALIGVLLSLVANLIQK